MMGIDSWAPQKVYKYGVRPVPKWEKNGACKRSDTRIRMEETAELLPSSPRER
jgi:hypothetical protein